MNISKITIGKKVFNNPHPAATKTFLTRLVEKKPNEAMPPMLSLKEGGKKAAKTLELFKGEILPKFEISKAIKLNKDDAKVIKAYFKTFAKEHKKNLGSIINSN